LNAIVADKANITNEASSASSVAEILTYYEKSACFNLNDRAFIIGQGLQEWLLAVMSGCTSDIAMVTDRRNALVQSRKHEADIVVLIANLIGGITDGQN
jgi:hypothetical protein